MTTAVCVVVPAAYAGALSVLLAHVAQLPVEPCLDYTCSQDGRAPATHQLLLGDYAKAYALLTKDRASLLAHSQALHLGWSALDIEDLVGRSHLREDSPQSLLWETSLMVVNRQVVLDRIASRQALAA